MGRLSSELLKQARTLANQDLRRPKDASIRRAISTAYYALFHFLLDEATGILVGTTQPDKPLRHILSRWFDHSKMAKACKKIIDLEPSSAVYAPFARSIQSQINDLLVVAKTFKELQEHRHRADYDLRARYTRAQALKSITDADEAMRAWNRIKNAPDRRVMRLVAVMLLLGEIERR